MINLTDAASVYIKKMLEKQQALGLRLSIKKTGCSGYSYLPTMVNKGQPTDILFETQGIKIFIDSAWLALLQGIQVDYIEEEKSGLKQKRLLFTNPNEAGRCGCGESFHVASVEVNRA